MGFERFIALRYLRARRKESFISLISVLSMLGVALGVAALIVVLSVMTGFETEWKNKILGLTSQVMILHLDGATAEPAKVVKKALADPEVTGATPFIYSQVMLVSEAAATGGVLRGVELPGALKVISLGQNLVEGSLDLLDPKDKGGLPGIVLGKSLARKLGVRLGEAIQVVNPLGELTPVGRAPKSEPFRVVGIFESGLYQYDSTLSYVSLSVAQEFDNMPGKATGVELVLKDMYQARAVGQRLVGELGPLYYASDWMSQNYSLFSALKLEQTAMFVILTLIVVVAAFGIVSSLVMLVMEKTRDIGVLKAMGATAASVRRIFMLEGLVIGGGGTLLGAGGGLGLCFLLKHYQFIELPKDVYAMSTLPVQIEPLTLGAICLAAVVLSLLATLYPARIAGRLDPVEALRYE